MLQALKPITGNAGHVFTYVCAFANADGGDLVYGIEDDSGVAKSLMPITAELAGEIRFSLEWHICA